MPQKIPPAYCVPPYPHSTCSIKKRISGSIGHGSLGGEGRGEGPQRLVKAPHPVIKPSPSGRGERGNASDCCSMGSTSTGRSARHSPTSACALLVHQAPAARRSPSPRGREKSSRDEGSRTGT